MDFYCNLYWGDGLEKKQKKILEKLKHGKFQYDLYLVVLSHNPDNQLEIIHSGILLQDLFPSEHLLVVGIAKGYDDALLMIENIVQEVYDNTDGAKVRAYIVNRQKEYEKNRM